MTTTAKLDVFTLRIREKGNKENYLKLNDIAGFNLIEELSQYLGKNIYLFKIDNQAERTSRIERNDLSDNSLFCRIKVGKFGVSSEIVDTLSGSGIFHKEKEHSDTIPLFFHVHSVKESYEATLHIERSGNRTLLPEIKNILTAVLTNLRDDKFVFEIKPSKKTITIANFINSGQGQLSSISLTLKNIFNNDFLEPTILTTRVKSRKEFPKHIVDMVIEISQSKDLKLLKNLLPKSIKKTEISGAVIELKASNRGKIKVNINRMISLPNSLTLQTAKEDLDKFGHPSYKYLRKMSQKYIE